MKTIISLFRLQLFYFPMLRVLFYIGTTSILLGLALNLMEVGAYQLQNTLIDGGFVLASLFQTFGAGAVLRRLLSNHHTRLWPRFRQDTLVAFTLMIGLFFLTFIALMGWQFRDVQAKAPAPLLFGVAALVYSVVPWCVFLFTKFRWGFLALWLGIWLTPTWFGANFRRSIEYFAGHQVLLLALLVSIWLIAITLIMRAKHIAPIAQLHKPNQSSSFVGANQWWLSKSLRFRSADYAMLMEGGDTWPIRLARAFIFLYVLPLLFWLFDGLISRSNPHPLIENAYQLLAVSVPFAFMLSCGMTSSACGKLRLIWLRTKHGRSALMAMINRLIISELLLLTLLALPLWLMACTSGQMTWLNGVVMFVNVVAIHWLTASSVAFCTLNAEPQWKHAATLFSGVILLFAAYLFLRFSGIIVPIALSGICALMALRLKKRFESAFCLRVDFNQVRPMQLGDIQMIKMS